MTNEQFLIANYNEDRILVKFDPKSSTISKKAIALEVFKRIIRIEQINIYGALLNPIFYFCRSTIYKFQLNIFAANTIHNALQIRLKI